jgi:hypothetical protein
MSTWSLRLSLLGLLAVAPVACGKDSNASPELCKTGALACQCYANDTCDDELSCLVGLCLDLSLGTGGDQTGAGGVTEPGSGGAGSEKNESGASIGGTTAQGGTTPAGGGSFSFGGSVNHAGMAGSGGTPPTDSFPPNPAGCALVTSCATCCETVGVFALDALATDATSRYVKAFDVTSSAASAEYQLGGSDAIGAIFFRFTSPQDINSLQISGLGTGGSLEIALVRAAGKDGCIYPVIAGSLSPVPDTCWGLGAGPYAVLPADQIEVRVRAYSPGPAALNITAVAFGP